MTAALSLVLLLFSGCGELTPQLLPAYAHNDYLNPRPLEEALELGYQGVEADYFVVDGELLLSHELEDIDPEISLQSVYLDPLRERIAAMGSVYGDGTVFLLNIESKEEGPDTYEALHRVLEEYRDILTVVEDGTVSPGPIQVVLVGWHPPLENLAAQPVRYVAVQMHYKDLPENHTEIPGHLLKMVTVNYEDTFRWRGEGPVSDRVQEQLARMVAARDAVEGRIIRTYEVPYHQDVYRALLEAGFDLIGTRNLTKTSEILARVQKSP